MDITLALGGGGSRGYSHIGVLRRLEQEGFRIRAVAGTSAGGIMAACYAAGFKPDELEEMFAKMDQSRLFAHSVLEGPGLLGLSGAAKMLEELFGDRTFADLRIPCALVAVDLKKVCEVILREGRIVDAILATIAVPGIFPPRQFGDVQLVDGGVLNPVPVSVPRILAPNLPVVAISLTSLVETDGHLTNLPLPVPVQLVERLTRTRLAQALNIFLNAVDAGGRMITELRLQADNPDIVICPNVDEIGLLDKVDVHAVVRLGEKATDAALPELKRAVAWPRRLQRSLFPRRME